MCGRTVVGGYLSPVHDAYGKVSLAPMHHRVNMYDLSGMWEGRIFANPVVPL